MKTLIEQKSKKASCLCASSSDYSYNIKTKVNTWNDLAQVKIDDGSANGATLKSLVDEYRKYTTPDEPKWKKLCKLKHTLDKLYKETIDYTDTDGSGDNQIARKKELNNWKKNLCVNINAYKKGKVKCTKEQLKALTCKTGEKKTKYQNKKGKCYCYVPKKGEVTPTKVDGCIDPKAFNYYCKERNADKSFKCGDDNNTLPEFMNYTQCEYRVDETLKYRYILSKLDNPDPEEGEIWEGDITITGSSSFDSPDDGSWLTKHYNPWKNYWTEKCSNISDTDIDFTTDKGLYVNQGDEDILPDLVNALLKFTSDEGSVGPIKNYKVMIMGEGDVNLGIVSLYKNNLTLDVKNTEGKPNKEITGYRVSKNSGGKISSKDAPNASVDDYRTYFRKRTSLIPLYANVTIDDNYIVTIGEPTNESIIGLGTLLERKNKPITGLGSLLED